MRTRMLPLAGLLLLAVPALTRAADDRPAVVLAVKSIDGLLADAKYVAELAGRDNEFEQLRTGLQRSEAGKALLALFDTKKPIGFYARVNADDIMKSEAVVLVPVKDPDGLIALLKKTFPNLTIKDKDADGVYEIQALNVQVPIYARFANDYAYITAGTKNGVAQSRLLAPEKVLPAEGTSLVSLAVHGDAIPAKYKDMAATAVARLLAQGKEQAPPNETPALKAARLAGIDELGDIARSVIEDGADLTLSLDVDRNAGELSASATFSARPGSKLAGQIADLATRKSVAAALIGSDSAANGILNVAVPPKVRDAAADAVIDQLKTGLAGAPGDFADAIIKAVTPTIKAGELDAGFDVRGPADGHYTAVAGARVEQGAALDKLVRDIVKTNTDAAKAIKLDADKVGGVAIHQILALPKDEGFKKAFGEKAEEYFAVRDDAVLVAIGPDALSAIKEAVQTKPATGPLFQLEASLSRLAPAIAANNPAAPDIAKKVFKDGAKDKIRVSVQGGKALTLKIGVDAPVVSFVAQLQEAQGK